MWETSIRDVSFVGLILRGVAGLGFQINKAGATAIGQPLTNRKGIKRKGEKKLKEGRKSVPPIPFRSFWKTKTPLDTFAFIRRSVRITWKYRLHPFKRVTKCKREICVWSKCSKIFGSKRTISKIKNL